MKKRLACIVLAALMVVGSGLVGNYIPNFDNNTAYAESLPGMALKFTNTGDRNAMQGQTSEVKYLLTNQTNEPITFDEVVVNFESKNGLKVAVNSIGTTTLKTKGSEVEIGFKLTTSRYYPTGSLSYTITLKNEGEEVYVSKYFYINVIQYSSVGDSSDPNYVDGVEIYSSLEPEDGLYIGSDNMMYFELYNAGNNRVKNAVLTISGFPSGVGINGGSTSYNIGYINSGETKNASFNLKVEDTAETGNYVFTATLNGLNQKNESISVAKSFYYYVYAKEKEEEDVDAEANPRIMVQDYTCGGGSVSAGSTVNLNMNLVNTSKKNLYNLKVAVSSDGTFVPVGSSNSFYVEKIASKEVINHVMTLKSDFEATPGAKGITVSMSYEDSKGATYTSEDTISIKVTQPCKLVIGQLTPPMEAYVGQEAYIELSYYNMGKNTLSNLMVSIAGNFDQTQNNSDFVGNMTSGTDNDYSCYVIPREVGPVEGVITIQYDDTEGQTVVEEVPFSFEAMEWNEEDWGWDEPEPVPEGPSVPWKAIIILGAILLLIIGFLVFRKIRKNRLNKKLAIEDAAYELPKEKEAAAAEQSGAKEE